MVFLAQAFLLVLSCLFLCFGSFEVGCFSIELHYSLLFCVSSVFLELPHWQVPMFAPSGTFRRCQGRPPGWSTSLAVSKEGCSDCFC